MSLYNMIMGENPAASDLLRLLGIEKINIPRYRDCWMTADWKYIVLLTRTGGANRKSYADPIDRLRELPGFAYDHDDEFDPTFMHFCYTVDSRHMGAIAANDAQRGPAYMAKVFEVIKAHGLTEPHPSPKIEAIRQGSLSVARKLIDAIEREPMGTIVRIGDDGKVTGSHG